jgi:hypothetical protein
MKTNKGLGSTLAASAMSMSLLLGTITAHATAVSWSFSGAPYDGSMSDLGGEVIVTLDDEDTAKTVKIRIDASGLPETNRYIRHLYLNTKDIDSDVGDNAISVSDITGSAAGSFEGDVSNEDGLAAGTGGSFDYRLAFFENGTDYFKGGEIFEATLTQNLNDLLVSSFFDTSVGGTAGAFEMALLVRSPDNIQTPAGQRTSDYFSGVRVVPIPAALPLFGSALAVLGLMGWRRRRS